MTLTQKLDFVSRSQSPATARLDLAVHLHLTVLDPDLCLPARADQAQPFEELIETQFPRF